MKDRIIQSSVAEQTKTGQLSDRAFYLIVVAFLLKEDIRPSSLQQFLFPEKFVVFNDEVSE